MINPDEAKDFADECQNKLDEVVTDMARIIFMEREIASKSIDTPGFSLGVQAMYCWLVTTARKNGAGLETITQIANYLGIEVPDTQQ